MSNEVKSKNFTPAAMVLILVLICILSVISIAVNRSKNNLTVNVYSCGELIYSERLKNIDKDIYLTIIPASGNEHPTVLDGFRSPEGDYNVVRINASGACVADSSCKNAICFHTGTINTPGIPIACLPNRLLITIIGDSEAGNDAYTY